MSQAYTYDPSAMRHVFEQHFTFLNGFLRNVHRYAGHLAMHDAATGRRWTYAELGTDSARLAAGLAQYGVRPGDVVMFQLYNCAEFALLYLAAQHLRAVAAPVNFRFSPGETAHVLDDSLPRVYVYDETLAPMAERALTLAAHTPSLLVTVSPAGAGRADGGGRDAAGQEASGRDAPGPDAAGAGSATVPFHRIAASTAALPDVGPGTTWDETTRLYTSGTTGMPKGVPLPSVAEVLTAHDVIMHFPLTPEDRTLNMTPWFHRGGISPGGPNAVFYAGGAVFPMRAFDAGACLDMVAEHRITFLIGAPTNLALLADEQEAMPRDLSTLRGVVTMGAPLERAACLRYQKVLTPNIFNGYGTTEAFWNTFLRPADLPANAGSAGRACTDDDVAVVNIYPDRAADPSDTVARDGAAIGEIIMRSVKSGYAYVNQPEEQAARFRGDWVYTGDMGTWDEREFVTIVGRKDDMIISGGENIYPVQVEETLNEHPLIADSAVVGLPDPRWGQIVVAYIQPAGPGLTAAECDRHCVEHPMLANYKRPRGYRFVDSLPRTATGKKMHYKVRAEVRATAGIEEFDRP